MKRLTRTLQGFGYRAGTDATGADLDGRYAAVRSFCFHLLQVRVPGGTGLVVGVADIVATAGAFAADFAFS